MRSLSTLIFVLFFLTGCYSHCDLIKKLKAKELNGHVSKKIIREWDRNTKVVQIGKKVDYSSDIYLRDETSGFWGYIAVGDSVIKEANKMEIIVFRHGDVKEFELTFPYCSEVH